MADTGKAAGGHARAASLTKAERSAIASKAAKKRWAGEDTRPPIPPAPPVPPPATRDPTDVPRRNDEDRDPTLYNRVFNTGDGKKVLEDLTARFYDVDTYKPGGLDAQRESDARGAKRSVVHFILRRIGQVFDQPE